MKDFEEDSKLKQAIAIDISFVSYETVPGIEKVICKGNLYIL